MSSAGRACCNQAANSRHQHTHDITPFTESLIETRKQTAAIASVRGMMLVYWVTSKHHQQTKWVAVMLGAGSMQICIAQHSGGDPPTDPRGLGPRRLLMRSSSALLKFDALLKSRGFLSAVPSQCLQALSSSLSYSGFPSASTGGALNRPPCRIRVLPSTRAARGS